MKTKSLCLVLLAIDLLCQAPCRGGVFLTTNGYRYFNNSALTQLNLTPVFAAEAGSGTVVAIQPNGQVTNYIAGDYFATSLPGWSNITSISMSEDFVVLALTEQGTVLGWDLEADPPYSSSSAAAQPPAGLSNVVAICARENEGLALRNDGTVVHWPRYDPISDDLSAVVAIDSDAILMADGTVDPAPAGVSNIIAISSDDIGLIGLRDDGTVVGWDGSTIYTNLIAQDSSNTVAISGGLNGFVGLREDGTIVNGGATNFYRVSFGFGQTLSNVCYLGREIYGNITAVTGDGFPRFTVQPRGQIVGSGQNIYLHARVVGQWSVQFQWQLNGFDLPGATNDDLIITNATPADAGIYQAIAGFIVEFAPYQAGSAVANVTFVGPLQVSVSLNAHIVQPTGALALGASSRGISFPLTASDSFVLFSSVDLTNWSAVTSANWHLANGLIELPPPRAGSLFYRFLAR